MHSFDKPANRRHRRSHLSVTASSGYSSLWISSSVRRRVATHGKTTRSQLQVPIISRNGNGYHTEPAEQKRGVAAHEWRRPPSRLPQSGCPTGLLAGVVAGLVLRQYPGHDYRPLDVWLPGGITALPQTAGAPDSLDLPAGSLACPLDRGNRRVDS